MKAAIVAGAIAIALAIAGCGEESTDGAELAGDIDITVSPAKLTDIVEETVDGSPDPEVRCAGRRICEVKYTIDKPEGSAVNQELFEKQRVVWAAMFSDPKLQEGVILLLAPKANANGEESTEEILRVRCDRGMANKLGDWETVTPKRVFDLCIWQEFVPLA